MNTAWLRGAALCGADLRSFKGANGGDHSFIHKSGREDNAFFPGEGGRRERGPVRGSRSVPVFQ